MSVAGSAAGINKMKILAIYKLMIRESQKFPAYNYRNYAIRRIRDAFRENKNLQDVQHIQEKINFAKQNLEIIRRQALVGQLYSTEKLIIENK